MDKITVVIDGKILKSYDELYLVSEYGDVYSTKYKKFLKHYITIHGYHRVDIHKKHIHVHKLVYLVWVGKIPKGLQINHIDDNKDNNHYSNLYVGSQKENILDCIKNNHRCGNVSKLIVFDKEVGKELTFCPATDFIKYSGHSCISRSLKKMMSKNWFKNRYTVIEYRKISNKEELISVTTNPDECKDVGGNLSPTQAHC